MNPRDLIIIGGGPCGLSAALIAAQNGLNPLIIEMSSRCGGQLLKWIDFQVKDMPSHLAISPQDLAQTMLTQGMNAGVMVMPDSIVHQIEASDEYVLFKINNNQELTCKRVVVATGLRQRTLNVPGEELNPYGTPHTPMDRTDKSIVVIGGGDEACSTTLALAKTGARVIQIVRNKLRARPRFARPILDHPHIKVMESEQVHSFKFDLNKVFLEIGSGITLEVDECYIRIGMEPLMPEIFPPLDLQQDNRIAVNNKGRTSNPLIYAGGDVTRPPPQRYIAISIADGVSIGRAISDELT